MEYVEYGKNERLMTFPNQTFNLMISCMEKTGFVRKGELQPGRIGKAEKETIRLFLTAVLSRYGSLPLDEPLGSPLPASSGSGIGSSSEASELSFTNDIDFSVPDGMFD